MDQWIIGPLIILLFGLVGFAVWAIARRYTNEMPKRHGSTMADRYEGGNVAGIYPAPDSGERPTREHAVGERPTTDTQRRAP